MREGGLYRTFIYFGLVDDLSVWFEDVEAVCFGNNL